MAGNAAAASGWGKTDAVQTKIKLPSFAKWRKLWRAQGIGSGVGIFEGVMPGAGGSIAAFMSYNEAKRWSSEPEKFGKGSEEGIAAPEAANNAVACTALVPVAVRVDSGRVSSRSDDNASARNSTAQAR